MKKAINLLFLLMLLAGCGKAAPLAAVSPLATLTASISTSTETPLPAQTIVIPTLAPDPTATADTRLPPERWREWPVVPQVTSRSIEVYRTGLAMGLDSHAFSKVGDCQSVKAAFMGYFDLGQYPASLINDYPNLQETINQFAGHFNTDGQAVRGGFNAASVLSPLWADPHACLPGENPLECELRITRPTIVIIRMEIWWDGRTAAEYEKLMRHILDTVIAHGAVPILATKADNVEGDNSLNLTTAKLAYEYDLPLWNFWAAVQPMPAHGMETKPPHNDGFHISTAAWSVQSFTALQALDSVWRGLIAAGPSGSTDASTKVPPTPTSGLATLPGQSSLPTATPTFGPTPVGGSERIIFGVASRQGEGYDFKGVYLFDLLTRKVTQVFGEGVRFQSASRDGRYILVSQGASLYRANVDGSSPVQISNHLFTPGGTTAVWLPDGGIAAILVDPDGKAGIHILADNGLQDVEMPASAASPIELYPAGDKSHVYWEAGSCSPTGGCKQLGAWRSSLNGISGGLLAGITAPIISPDENALAYIYPVSSTEADLGLAKADGTAPQQVPLPGKLLTAYSWSPDSTALAVTMADVSDYSGLTSGNRNFMIDVRTRAIVEFTPSALRNPILLWSPDGQELFWLGSLSTDGSYKIGADLVDIHSRTVTDMSDSVAQSGPEYLLITNAAWLPLP